MLEDRAIILRFNLVKSDPLSAFDLRPLHYFEVLIESCHEICLGYLLLGYLFGFCDSFLSC